MLFTYVRTYLAGNHPCITPSHKMSESSGGSCCCCDSPAALLL